MKPRTTVVVLLLCCFLILLTGSSAPVADGHPEAGAPYVPRTMRVDYYHTGNSKQEWFSLDRSVIEPLEWPGNLSKAIDDSQLGNYLFEVRQTDTGKLLYSRGFNSVFGEWRTTEEALHANRTFSESLRFPTPSEPVIIILKERNEEESAFHEVWQTSVDPKDKFVDTSPPTSPGPLLELQRKGPPSDKVDLLLLGDGYTAQERGKFESDARRYMETLFSISPFREHRGDFNVWGLCPPAQESGVSRPSNGIHRHNPLGTTYDTFGTERYVLTTDNRALRDAASFAPYEFIEILVNSPIYGGGGIFNQFSTVAIDNMWAGYVGVHEFGHQFAGLADEYYSSDVAYLPSSKKTEPWEPNVTALLDPAKLKWMDLVEPGTPIPTPWDEKGFNDLEKGFQQSRKTLRSTERRESEMEGLFRREQERENAFLSSQKYSGKVGAFEGADYMSKGYYRPEVNCIMFTRYNAFCAVCRRAIQSVIKMYTD